MSEKKFPYMGHFMIRSGTVLQTFTAYVAAESADHANFKIFKIASERASESNGTLDYSGMKVWEVVDPDFLEACADSFIRMHQGQADAEE